MADNVHVKCSVCGRELPNRFAVAGRCTAEGCDKAFCALHWHNGNHRCPEHGWQPATRDFSKKEYGQMSENSRDDEQKEKELQEQAEKLPSAKKASILKQIGAFVSSIGHGTSALVRKITGYKSPGEVMDGINAQLDSMRAAREPLAKRHSELYSEIVAKKKLYQSAPPARRKVLEMELKSAIAEYQSLERQIAAYLRNETVLVKVKGRMCELVAMNLKVVSEDDIDKLTDRIENAADEVQDIDGAVADLDKAGVRRETKDASFEDVLAAFGDEITDAEAPSSQLGDAPGRADPLSDF